MHDYKVTMLLADAAQEVDGKLYILGGGWSIIGPGPSTFAIAVYIQTGWHRTSERHTFRLELLDADGAPVTFAGLEGDQPLFAQGEFEPGRPAGLKDGTPIDTAFAISFAGVQLPKGSRLEWRLSIDGASEDGWSLPFTTRTDSLAQAA